MVGEGQAGDYGCYCKADAEPDGFCDAWVVDFFVDMGCGNYGHAEEGDGKAPTVEPERDQSVNGQIKQ